MNPGDDYPPDIELTDETDIIIDDLANIICVL
jgi:hypothetical protein